MSISHNKCLTGLICLGFLLGVAPLTVIACNPPENSGYKLLAQPVDEWQDDELSVCHKALSGQMTVEVYKKLSTPVSDEKIAVCALDPYVADPFYSKAYYEKVWEVKKELVEELFSKELDVSYVDESGRNFALAIFFTPHSEEWRIKMLKIFKAKGGDLFKRNDYNRSALDYARSDGDTKIIEYLQSAAQE